jgi:TRAP-type C4-dicarboxylate transport system permease small subunit
MSEASPEQGAVTRGRLGQGLAALAVLILLANVALIAFDVVMRWLLRMPQSWVADLAQVSYPVAIACCFPAALESGHMFAIRFLGERLGARATRVLDLFGQAALTAVTALLAWKMVERAAADWGAGYRTSTIDLPLAPTWATVAALLVLCALIQLRLTWRALRDD